MVERLELIEFLRACGVDEGRAADLSALERLRADLVEANRVTNLTRLTDEDDFWLRHVADSLAVGLAAPDLLTDALAVADVGCGAGFPALPLAWANPRLAITAIDARGRKIEFVARQIEAMGLSGCRATAGQVRELARQAAFAGAFDVVLLRAVGTPGKLLREVRGLLRAGCGARAIFYKTPDAADAERDLSRREAAKFGLEMTEPAAFRLPGDGAERGFVIFTRP